jgi:folate-binding protein YgfZ
MSAEVYKLIRVTGNDAGEFLQGQLTQDMEKLAQSGSLPAAWCNPKGRVITLLRIVMIDGGYGLVLPASMAETVCQRLTVFRFRSDVSLEVADSDWACLIINTDDDLDRLDKLGLKPERAMNACRIAHGLIAVNVGIEEVCVELMGFNSDLEKAGFTSSAPADDLRAAKIRAGIPEITERYSEKFTPHMLNLDLLGAISFEKGCYTGQEVVARTQNLGKSKRRLMRYRSDATLATGDKLSDGDRDVGEVINVFEADLLAVTPVDALDKRLVANDADVAPLSTPY